MIHVRNSLIRIFRGYSLRQRFLVAPLLGLVVCSLLTAAFIYESQRQNALLSRITDQDFTAFNHYSEVFVNLTEQHTALYNLLQGAGKLDEETLYDKAKQHLHNVHQAVDGLEQALPHGGNSVALELELRNNLLVNAQAYREGVSAAVEMVTVNLALAPEQLAFANQRFTALNRSFVRFLDLERAGISSDITARIRHSQSNSATIAIVGVSVAALLFFLSHALSRMLSRSIETQIGILTDLGAQAGARLAGEGYDEVQRMTQAIAAFQQSLLDLRQSRDKLEERIAERTQELSNANVGLRSEIKLREEAERHLRIYAEVIRSTGEAVVITDPDGTVVEVNPAYQRATGRSREEVIGTNLQVLGQDPHPEAFYEKLWRDLKVEGYWSGEMLDRRRDGESFPCWALFNAVRDEGGKTLHYVGVLRDITTLKQNEEQLQKLAFYDSLTGLPNRTLFKDRLNVALAGAARQQASLAMMYLDLDRFKYVNDTLGHAAGDRLLIEISQRIGRCLRSADTLARMGGDEFTILLPHLDTEADAVQVAERIVEAVGKAVQLDEETVYVGASVGIAFFPKDGRDATTMQKYADLAMYEAKDAGRGQYRIFSPQMLGKGDQRLSLSVQIDAALRRNEFTLAYQPIVNLATGHPEGVEALIRWQKPGGEFVAPTTFIPHAEQSGLIKKIDCWVLERACRDAMTWLPSAGRVPPVCVNLSAVSVQQPDMAKLIKDILRRTELPPSRLNLEITENAVKADPNAAQAMLEEITSLGVSFSVNDFGTGYSSLSYLSQFPINCLKLDRLFIERIGKNKASEEVIQTLIQLAHKLRLRVVAEGVEQQDQQTFLTDAGCELMQGYHFVRPMAGGDLLKWLASRSGLPAREPAMSVA
jgi:diguanylate cyclase (GGDEF)-like protein/PAS domain S-box-containing protein